MTKLGLVNTGYCKYGQLQSKNGSTYCKKLGQKRPHNWLPSPEGNLDFTLQYNRFHGLK